MLKYIASIAALLVAGVVIPGPAAHAQEERSDWLDIELGKSIVLETPRIPRAISITNPKVANVVQLGTPTKWQVQGLSLGTTDLVIQFADNVPPMIYEITVHQDLSDIVRRVDAVVPNSPPRVYPLGPHIVVEGQVPDLDTLERVAMIAQIWDPEFVNLMTVSGDHQVQLEVTYAEVSRTGLREMGLNLLYNTPGIGAGMLRGAAQPLDVSPLLGSLADTAMPFASSAFNLYGIIGQGIGVGGVLSILDRYGLAKVISQPTLMSLSGQKAEFLAGGEVPQIIPSANGASTVTYKQFGTHMTFVPTVLGDDVVDVQVELEVSSLDPALGVTIQGASVAGFNSRKASTHIRLRSGMTFAIAGLLSEKIAMTRDEVPGLGRIPVIGALFRNVKHTREETEMIVYVTPRLVRPMAPGEVPALLGTTENNNPSDLALFLLGADHRAHSRTATPTGEVGLQR